MVLKDIVAPDSRLYAKSEWAAASALWPALSFSQRGVANKFGGLYSQGRDFVITVGTGNPKETPDPAHRQRLMSIVDVAPNVIVATGDLVEPETWRRAQRTTKCESASRISIARYSNSTAKLSRLNFMPGRFRPVDVRGPRVTTPKMRCSRIKPVCNSLGSRCVGCSPTRGMRSAPILRA